MAGPARHAIEMWEPRRAVSLKGARLRSSAVRVLRVVFVLLAALSVLLLAAPVIGNAFAPGRIAYRAPALSVTILNPRFEGRDAMGRPYVITADQARRRPDNPSVVDLVNPRLRDHASSVVEAREGVFDRESQVLDLVDDVRMTDAAGYDFTTEAARMIVRESRVEGRTVLRGGGPLGEVRANSYEVLDDGDRIILRGQVWTRFQPGADRP